MADDLSISYSLGSETPPEHAAEELVAFADCELIGLNPQMMLVINRQNGKQQVLAPQVVEGLTTCTTFRSIAEHAKHLAETRPELKGQEAMARQVLEQLSDAGMLLRASTISERLNQPVEKTPAAPTRAFIITCDRPEAVQRLLSSLLRAGNLTRQDALFLVDDSRDPANREANREAVATFNLTSARDMYYVGADAQAALMQGLIAANPEHEAGIRFLIDPAQWTGRKTYGRARTLALLLSVGYRAIVMDDDILCQAILPPVREEGIGISGGGRKAAFFPDKDTLMHSGQPADFDPLTGHAVALGRSLSEAIQALNGGPLDTSQLQRCNAAMTNVLSADSPILVTQCGSWGDPGTGSAHWALSLDEDSVDRLVTAPHGMAEALENRLAWLGSSRHNIMKMAFMSQMTGLDNSALLPPYFPVFRGEDLLFGAMVEAMHHRAAIIEYGWAVPHLPLESRRDRGLREPIAGAGGVSLFARYLTERIDYKDATNPAQRLRHLAADARRVANRSNDDLLLDYRTELARGHADQLRALNQQFQRSRDLPSNNWQGYLQRGMEEMQQVLVNPRSPTQLKGIAEGTSEAEVLARFRELARGWADALDGWVAVREASVTVVRELVDDGVMAA
ncbi:hypothetical protein [Chromatocurvus halotolerans]|uniref:Uncharacterized protein n=1 Tax=Chromatocurvus halotolerans TaxID=1132028 RepID=A0A4R2KT62_9GAMM|nr:hypothetical protein [Chromatocurvus halotolerans]TCO69875.1 hypothetical protein EV688_1298 [Chromatocurvus halotolerans]